MRAPHEAEHRVLLDGHAQLALLAELLDDVGQRAKLRGGEIASGSRTVTAE